MLPGAHSVRRDRRHRLPVVVIAALIVFAAFAAAAAAQKPSPPPQYRAATNSEKQDMTKAIPKHGPYKLKKSNMFGWYVFKDDGRFGIVCAKRHGMMVGDPVHRKHVGGKWKFGPTDSGDLTNATYQCGVAGS